MSERKAMIDKTDPASSASAQSKLLGISRSGLYYRPSGEREENLAILRLPDEQYMKTPFYGVRRIVAWLGAKGYPGKQKACQAADGAGGLADHLPGAPHYHCL